MAIQELDLHIQYRPGKLNSNVDALFRCPVTDKEPCNGDSPAPAIVAATNSSWVRAKDGEPTLPTLQRRHCHLGEIIEYLKNSVLPQEDKRAREDSPQPITVPDCGRCLVSC